MSANPKLAKICPKNQNSDLDALELLEPGHKLLYIEPHGPADQVDVGGREIGPMRAQGVEGLAGSIAQVHTAEVLLIEGSRRIRRGGSPGTCTVGATLPRTARNGS